MRVYIPATLPMLQELVADGYLQPRAGTAFAVTPALRESYAEGDDENWPRSRSARPHWPRCGCSPPDPDGAAAAPGGGGRRRRRDNVTLRPDLDDAVVRVSGRLTMDQVVAVYVDNADAEPAVRAGDGGDRRGGLRATRTPS